MKTSPAARRILKIRVALTSLAIVGILGLELCLGFAMAARVDQTTGGRTNSPAVPNVSFSDMMVAAR